MSEPPPAAIRVRDVSKWFARPGAAERLEALSDLSFDLPANSFVSVIGPSGCGKTTLLRLLDGVLRPDRGEISVHGAAPKPGAETGFVFQSFRLMPWRTVRSNVAFPLEIARVDRATRRARTDDFLARVGLSEFADAYPGQLSGGMKQRVALARALVGEPRLMLMDEPFASLDAQTREFMQIELLQLWQRLKGEVVFVTHSVDEAITLSDRIVVFGPRPGRVVDTVEVRLPRPRWDYDLHAHPDFIALRAHLWGLIKDMVSGFGADETDRAD